MALVGCSVRYGSGAPELARLVLADVETRTYLDHGTPDAIVHGVGKSTQQETAKIAMRDGP
jgi:hypothetical protein